MPDSTCSQPLDGLDDERGGSVFEGRPDSLLACVHRHGHSRFTRGLQRDLEAVRREQRFRKAGDIEADRAVAAMEAGGERGNGRCLALHGRRLDAGGRKALLPAEREDEGPAGLVLPPRAIDTAHERRRDLVERHVQVLLIGEG